MARGVCLECPRARMSPRRWGVPGSLVGEDFRIAAAIAVLGFAVGLALTLASSELFARGLTRLGTKLHFSEGLIGLLAAVGADSPELSSALIALAAGAGSVGVGVIVGSNLFNIAALLGLAALVARGVRIRRGPLLLDAAVGLIVLAASAAMVAGLLAPAATATLIVPLAALYVLILATEHRRLPLLRPLLASAPHGLVEVAYEVSHDRPPARHPSWLPVAFIPPALVGVVGGSFLMVHEALASQQWLHVSTAVLGTIILAALTSLPNLWVALHFARTDRGTALFSSAMNSNTINLVGGLVVPALFIGTAVARGSLAYFTWLAGLTLLAVLAPLPRARLSRFAGALIIAIYLVFVLMQLLGV
jgi:cation:H+ antiporter